MTTLAQINDTLETHTPLLQGAKDGISNLSTSFNRFMRGTLDDLESQRERMGEGTTTAPTSTQVQQTRENADGGLFPMGMLSGLFAGLGGAFSLATIGALFRSLLKRGIFVAAAAVLANEIGKYVKNATGSELIGDITEKGIVYGSLGALLFGKKGAIGGAIIGASIVFGDRLAEEIRKYKIGGEEFSNVLAEATKSATTIATGVGVGFLFGGPVGAIVGGLVAGIPELVRLISLYKTDEDFKKDVDALFAKISDAVKAIYNQIESAVNGVLDGIASFFTFSSAERERMRDLDPQLLKQIEDNEARISELKKQRIANASNVEKRREIQRELSKLEAETDDLTDKAEDILSADDPYNESVRALAPQLIENDEKVKELVPMAERIALQFGKSESEAEMIRQGYESVLAGRTGAVDPEAAAEKFLARSVGAEIEDVRSQMNMMNQGGITRNPHVDARQISGDTNVVTQNTQISTSGSSVDKSDLVSNAMQNLSGRPVN